MATKGKIYKSFKHYLMKEPEIVLCDTKNECPMTYNGIKNAKKAALKNDGEVMRIPGRMNRFYIIQKK